MVKIDRPRKLNPVKISHYMVSNIINIMFNAFSKAYFTFDLVMWYVNYGFTIIRTL